MRAVALLLLILAQAGIRAQSVTTLYTFGQAGGDPDGRGVYGSLIQASDGNLYGTTEYGADYGVGSVFQLTLSGTLTTLYAFPLTGYLNGSGAYRYGADPNAGLIQASDGNLYGTTQNGGAYYTSLPESEGTVFQITTGGAFTSLYSFNDPLNDVPNGASPRAGLLQAKDGNLYGTTAYGPSQSGVGTVFQITTGGALTTLHAFTVTNQGAEPDGAYPYAGLIQG